MKALEDAWADYRQFCEAQRQALLGAPWAEHKEERVALHALLLQIEAAAYNLVIAPRTGCPTLMQHAVYEPVLYNYGDPAADFNYRYAFLDGARRYRLWGKRNTTHMLDFQVQAGFFGTPGARTQVASCDFGQLQCDADGHFELELSATAVEGNWIALDAGSPNNYLLVREIVADWANERPAELHIEALDGTDAIVPLNEAGMIDRLQRAQGFIGAIINGFCLVPWTTLLAEHGLHRLSDEIFGRRTAAINPSAIYPAALYELEPGEALLIECEAPRARFWNVELLDRYGQLCDYAFRQGSLNSHQIRIDDDGMLRAVVSLDDPGIDNWLDPSGRRRGIVQFRFLFAEHLVLPTLRKLPLSELPALLPTDTPRVTSEQRTASLSARRHAALARFGY